MAAAAALPADAKDLLLRLHMRRGPWFALAVGGCAHELCGMRGTLRHGCRCHAAHGRQGPAVLAVGGWAQSCVG